jgi:hypothetical protein
MMAGSLQIAAQLPTNPNSYRLTNQPWNLTNSNHGRNNDMATAQPLPFTTDATATSPAILLNHGIAPAARLWPALAVRAVYCRLGKHVIIVLTPSFIDHSLRRHGKYVWACTFNFNI